MIAAVLLAYIPRLPSPDRSHGAGLAGGMSGTVEMSALTDQLTTVTERLGVAFDTTLVALCMSTAFGF